MVLSVSLQIVVLGTAALAAEKSDGISAQEYIGPYIKAIERRVNTAGYEAILKAIETATTGKTLVVPKECKGQRLEDIVSDSTCSHILAASAWQEMTKHSPQHFCNKFANATWFGSPYNENKFKENDPKGKLTCGNIVDLIVKTRKEFEFSDNFLTGFALGCCKCEGTQDNEKIEATPAAQQCAFSDFTGFKKENGPRSCHYTCSPEDKKGRQFEHSTDASLRSD